MNPDRIKYLKAVIYICFLVVFIRLFYLQIIRHESFRAQAVSQYQSFSKAPSRRGDILASDSFPLAYSYPTYLLFADPKLIQTDASLISTKLTTLLEPNASPSAQLTEINRITNLISQKNLRWVPLNPRITRGEKQEIDTLNLTGIGTQELFSRFYPESSMSAHLLGFVGKDEAGLDKGYFGLEGYYDLDLSGGTSSLREETDPRGFPIIIGKRKVETGFQGRTLKTSINRTVQYLVEKKLKDGIERYGAKSGTVTIMEPQTGKILAMASYPSYDPLDYANTDQSLYKNPIVSENYEPGSTFKVLVMAAAINEKVVTPDSVCTKCAGPVTLDKYTIRTWNNTYHPNSTMTEVIKNSDNIGMVFAADKLGTEKFVDYFEKFGFMTSTGIDLQEEAIPLTKAQNQWTYIDRSTASFGQGISVTPIQMIRAVAAIANGGFLVSPHIVDEIISDKETIKISPKPSTVVISSQTAKSITEMMVNAVDNGEAKWAKPKDFKIAGKTGTAQIPVLGHYDAEKTIASFVGFAPADNPKFIMLVTLREPQTSQWGSETAAPLWFLISRDLFRLLNITP